MLDENNDIQVEFVGPDGHTLLRRPVSVEELLRQEDHTLPIGNGVSLRLEELMGNEDDYEEDEEDDVLYANDSDDDASGSDAADDANADESGVKVPPGATVAGDWYEVLNALRREKEDVREASKEVRREMRERAASSASKVPRSKSVDVTLLRSQTANDSAAGAAAADTAASRRDVWASFGAPPDKDHNYNAMRYVSIMDDTGRQFRPPALSFHAAASYLSSKDRGQRFLVYGGVASGAARAVERELYEFSVLTGVWKRLEGRQFVPAGHYGHTLTVVEAVDRVVVIGGLGPGGLRLDVAGIGEDALRAPRAKLLMPLGFHVHTQKVAQHAAGEPPSGALAPRTSTTAAPLGFVPYVFDMDLSTQSWRAVQTASPFPLAFHSAVSFGKEVFVFGGLTEQLQVSSELLAVDVTTYAVRLIRASDREVSADADAAGPPGRFLHAAVRYGNYMIVFGGLDKANESLDDTWAFDMVNERWERLRCRGDHGPRAGHTASVVGCRMVVVGGFEVSLESMGEPSATPVDAVMELNLVPTTTGEYLWRGNLRTRPKFPLLAFSAAASCGDDLSLLVFGGLVKRPKRRAADTADGAKRGGGKAAAAADPHPHHRSQLHQKAPDCLLSRFLTLDDGLIMTFPAKKAARAAEDAEEEPHVNELGVEVDPDELPESFKAFVRRQEDFVKKKNAAVDVSIKRTVLDEREMMEPTVYLTDDEIEMLCAKGESCCQAFVEEYKMDALPSNVPDREARIHIIEECISLSRQARDILKSMRGSAPGVTAVKSKTHRRRAGQKFEDYSAAKPFRRVVVSNLIQHINAELAHMHRLNKGLRTVEWEEKDAFVEAIGRMQGAVNALSQAANRVINKYINHRVEQLMKGVDKHKEVMRLLTEVVERNRRDKIFHTGARDKQRERVKKEWAKSEAAAAAGGTAPRVAGPAVAHPKRSASPYLGAGFHKDEDTTCVTITGKEYDWLLHRATQVAQQAHTLAAYCQESIDKTPGSPAQAASLGLPTPALPAPGLLLAPGLAPPTLSVGPASPPAVPPAQEAAGEGGGSASPKDILIRRSNENRQRVIQATAEAESALHGFIALMRESTPLEPAAPGAKATVAGAALLASPPPPQLQVANTLSTRHDGEEEAGGAEGKKKGEKDKEEKEEDRRRYHVFLKSLRFIAEAREKLESVSKKVPLIHLNEWDSGDLAGAPADTKAAHLYDRLRDGTASLSQRLTASFLTRAGTRQRRSASAAAPASTSQATKPRTAAARSRSKRAPKASGEAEQRHVEEIPAATVSKKVSFRTPRTQQLQQSQQLLFQPPQPQPPQQQQQPQQPLSLASSSRRQRVSHDLSAYGALSGSGSSAGAPSAFKDLPLPVSLRQVQPADAAKAKRAPDAPEQKAMAALNMPPAHYLAQDLAALPNQSSTTNVPTVLGAPATVPLVEGLPGFSASSTAADVDPTNADEVLALPNRPQVVPAGVPPRPAPGVLSPYANAWALYTGAPPVPCPQAPPPPLLGDTRPPGPPAPASLEIVPAAGPALHTPVAAVIRASDEEEARPLSTAPRRSTIRCLARAQSGNQSSSFAAEADEPVTGISPGSFVVNAEYYQRTTAGADTRAPPAATAKPLSWADADDDYFYFGRAPHRLDEEKRAPPVSAAVAPAFARRASPQLTVGPPVGSELVSQRVNAEYCPGRSVVPLGNATNRPSSATARAASKHSSAAPSMRIVKAGGKR